MSPRKKLGSVRRRPIPLTSEALVEFRAAPDGGTLPGLVVPRVEGVHLPGWVAENRQRVLSAAMRHGALLFRGFRLAGAEDLATFARACAAHALMEYSERSSPRRRLTDDVYTSTEYPASRSIFLHNENAYAYCWPRRLCFLCVKPARRGGDTPLADTRRVLDRIEPSVRQRFQDQGVLYVRSYGGRLGLHWRDVFQTDSAAEVESQCREAGYRFEWGPDDRLKTWRRGPSVVVHPDTGELSWFNHAAFFHHTTLEESLGCSLDGMVGEDELPVDTFYGDGQPIETELIAAVREAYAREAVRFNWQTGDVLLIDNLVTAHGRDPFEGDRVVQVTLLDAMTRDAAKR